MAYLNTALIDLFSAYFVFNIAYPLAGVPILFFFQHYVFGLKDRQKIPDTQYPSLFSDDPTQPEGKTNMYKRSCVQASFPGFHRLK